MIEKDIYTFIRAQETAFDQPININGWEWNLRSHIKTSFYYIHGRLLNGNDEDTPVKNITRPILNLQSRAEDIDVKDIVLYVDDPDSYHLSFLVKKYHDDVFVIENDLDTFYDEIKESKIHYGGGLCKKMADARPQMIDLQSIAFCDQTSLLGGPIGIRHYFAPDELKEMEAAGWGRKENGATGTIDELITLGNSEKVVDKMTGTVSKTTGTNVEIYEVHGMLPLSYLEDSGDPLKYEYQLHIIGFYKNDKDEKIGISLFRKKQKKGNLKLVLRDRVFSRALGFGGAEEIFEPQVWTNYDVIRQKELLDACAKVILQTTDPAIAAKHPSGLKNLDNLEILTLAEGTDLKQVDNTPRSMALFERAVSEWNDYARTMGGATEALLGKNAPSGTPFKLQDLVTTQGQGLHDYRRGKFAKFIEEIYKDWIIPHIAAEITSGSKFLSELSTDEMQYVADCVVRSETNSYIKRKIIAGGLIEDGEVEAYKQLVREEFRRGGNKKFIEILKGEFDKKPLRVKVNVAGKQKDLGRITDAVVNILKQAIASPEGFQMMMQNPDLARNFNKILEYSNLSPADFSNTQYKSPIPSPLQMTKQATPA